MSKGEPRSEPVPQAGPQDGVHPWLWWRVHSGVFCRYSTLTNEGGAHTLLRSSATWSWHVGGVHIIAGLEIGVLVASSQHFCRGGGSSERSFRSCCESDSCRCLTDRVNMGFHLDSQAIEAALGCVQCSTIFCTGKVVQSSFVHSVWISSRAALAAVSCVHAAAGEARSVHHYCLV